jgi:hypothetical protein
MYKKRAKTKAGGKRKNAKRQTKSSGLTSLLGGQLLSRDGKTVADTIAMRSRGIGRLYTLEQIVSLTNIASSATAITYGALTFQLSDLSTSSSLTTLFDKYRLKEIEIIFFPIDNQYNIDVTGSATIGNFYTAIDFDNASAPTSIAQIERYSTSVVTSGNKPQYRHFRPRTVRPVYISGVSTGYAEGRPDDWLDCAYPSIPYYALLYALSQTANAGTCTYGVRARYMFQFAATR